MESNTNAALDKTLHVIEDSEGWSLIEGETGESTGDIGSRFDTKAAALAEARRRSVERGVEVVVHGPDGSVQERDMFVR